MTVVSKHVTNVLNGTIQSVKNVLPFSLEIDRPSVMNAPMKQSDISVLIGMTGQIKGRLVIESSSYTVSSISEKMYGMQLEGEMLHSFIGELGNMIAGNLSTIIANNGFEMDITPPTVFVGHTEIYGFSKALHVPIHVPENNGNMNIILMLEELR